MPDTKEQNMQKCGRVEGCEAQKVKEHKIKRVRLRKDTMVQE